MKLGSKILMAVIVFVLITGTAFAVTKDNFMFLMLQKNTTYHGVYIGTTGWYGDLSKGVANANAWQKEKGIPIDKAIVTLTGLKAQYSAITGPDGWVRFFGVIPDDYSLSITRYGFKPVSGVLFQNTYASHVASDSEGVVFAQEMVPGPSTVLPIKIKADLLQIK